MSDDRLDRIIGDRDIGWTEYRGGQPFPADLWGAAPLRGQAVVLIEDYIRSCVRESHDFGSGEIVDLLINAGLFPNECNDTEPPIYSVATDESGHAWRRDEDGDWVCVSCENSDIFSWKDVQDDATGKLTVERPE